MYGAFWRSGVAWIGVKPGVGSPGRDGEHFHLEIVERRVPASEKPGKPRER